MASMDQEKQYDRKIGQILRNERIRSGMTQEELGKGIGVTFQQIQKYEKGINRISLSKLMCACNVINTNIHDFISQTEDRNIEINTGMSSKISLTTMQELNHLTNDQKKASSNL